MLIERHFIKALKLKVGPLQVSYNGSNTKSKSDTGNVAEEEDFPPLLETAVIPGNSNDECVNEATLDQANANSSPKSPQQTSWAQVVVAERKSHFQSDIPMLEHKP